MIDRIKQDVWRRARRFLGRDAVVNLDSATTVGWVCAVCGDHVETHYRHLEHHGPECPSCLRLRAHLLASLPSDGLEAVWLPCCATFDFRGQV